MIPHCEAVATRAWTNLNADRLKYEMIFTPRLTVAHGQITTACHFITGSEA